MKLAEEDSKTGTPALPTYWNTGRKIITLDAAEGQVPFRWAINGNGIGTGNMAQLDPTSYNAQKGDESYASGSDWLDHIRGDRKNEYPSGNLRGRGNSLIGDIVHSNPVYVGAFERGDPDREARIYAGANDGMLHAFDASDGSEVYAYVPAMLMPELPYLVGRPYQHRYFVDGKLTVADALIGESDAASWRTVLVGALGAGGRGFFVLDVTDPDLTSEDSTADDDKKVMWEVKATDSDYLGDSYSRAVIAKLNDDRWYAVLGNGYNSPEGEARLVLFDLTSGTLSFLQTSGTNADKVANPNGLSSPALLDVEKDGRADYAYAGDMFGNLWKFDLTGDADDWAAVERTTITVIGDVEQSTAVVSPLFTPTVAAAQPITMEPKIVRHPSENGYIVYFATGRFYDADTDTENTPSQFMYGIWDDLDEPESINLSLLEVNWKDVEYDSEDIVIRFPDVGSVDWTALKGWKMEFPTDYRVLEGIVLRGDRIKGVVTRPVNGDVKATNYLSENALADGGPHPTPIYDLSGNNALDPNDLYIETGVSSVPMGMRQADGIMSRPTVARIQNGVDTLFLNHLDPPYSEPCTGDCEGGFQGGHIDVDTWHDDKVIGAGSTKHEHEYDKKTGRVYVDYLDTNFTAPAGSEDPIKSSTGHVELDQAGMIDSNMEFILLVANADFSPGAEFIIGAKSWNVVEYQQQLHKALYNWVDPDEDPMDEKYDTSLVFTLDQIVGETDDEGNDGTVRQSFDDLAIVAGGLHPTQTGCVKDAATGGDGVTTYENGVGRWRNGALVTQLIKADWFRDRINTTDPVRAISLLTLQTPADLKDPVVFGNKSIQLSWVTPPEVEYRTMGGLILDYQNGNPLTSSLKNDAHMWESTLFWHFGDLYSLLVDKDSLGANEKDKPCYGHDNWEEAVRIEQGGVPDLLDSLGDGFETLEEALAYAESDSCVAAVYSCAKVAEALEKLLENDKDKYDPYFRDEGDGDDSDDLSPLDMGGDVTSEYTQGPSFDYGRVNWTDVPQEPEN